MSSGLAALLDDVAAIAKLASASLDDVGAAAGKASAKAAGVVIDDTAVTPTYVTGFSPNRELPIIWRITLGSLRNKLLILLPVALLLSVLAPWAITPLLMLGGTFLCYEGAEKIAEIIHGGDVEDDPEPQDVDAVAMEKARINGAIRTDLILSAEIMAIALADLAQMSLLTQAISLAVVGILVTAGVYGVVALIVKMDDIGLVLARRGRGVVAGVGRLLVRGMPTVLSTLSSVGMIAMLWVGGGILLHGVEVLHLSELPTSLHHLAEATGQMLPMAQGLAAWFVMACMSAVAGLAVGLAVVILLHRALPLLRGKH